MKARSYTNVCMLALSLALFCWPAAAQTTVGTLDTIATSATFLNTGVGTGSAGETLYSKQWVALQFTLTAPSAITDVQGYFGPYGTSGAVNVVIWTNNTSLEYPVPGQAIWTQSYTLTAPATTAAWVNFPNYLAVLAPGTYWVAFEAPSTSTVNVGMQGPATTPAANNAFFDVAYNTWTNFVSTGVNTNTPAAMLSGYDLGTASGAPLITSGTFARTITTGTPFNVPPSITQDSGAIGNVGQYKTLSWNIISGLAVASAYGTITANPKTAQGNILQSGALSSTGPNSSEGGARGIVFSTYLNTTGKAIPNVQVNAALTGAIANAASKSPVTVSAAAYVFDPAAFTTYINSVVPNQYPTLGQFLLGGDSVVVGQGSYYEPDLGLLFPSYVDDSWNSNNASNYFEICYGATCPEGFEVSTSGFALPAYAVFTVMFDVSAASIGPASGQSSSIANFLDTLQSDVTNGMFTDGSSANNGLGNPITGIAGPLTMALPDTPASIALSPSSQSTPVGSTTVVTATVTDASGNPVPDAIVNFTITSGPHAGYTLPVGTGDGTATLPNGTLIPVGAAIFTYTDTLGAAGTDSISASVGSIAAASPAQVTWTTPGPLFNITLSPATNSITLGNSQTYDATGTDYFGNSVGDVTSQLTFSISPDGGCTGAVCTPAAAGPHTVTGSGTNPVVGTITGTASLTVNSATTPTLTITASSGTMTYGGTVPAITPSYSGFVNGDTPASLTTQPTCSTTAASGSPVGPYTSSCSGAVDSKYNITYVPGSVSVGPAALSITASNGTMTFGGTPPTVTPSYSGFVAGNTASSLTTPPACTTTATSSTPVGTDTGANACSGAVDANYTISYVPGNVTVSQATLTITASNGTMTFGGTPPTVTPSYSGFVAGNTASSLTTAPTCTTTATSSTPVGTDTGADTCSGAVDPNYSISYVAGNVTVSQATLTITASNGTMTFGGTPPSVTPSYSGFVNGNTASSLTTQPTCVTSATSSTPAGTDTGADTCSGAVDANYTISYVPGNVTVGQAALTITASSGTMTYGGTPPAVTPSYSGFVAGNTASSLTTQPTCLTSATSSTPAGTDTGADTCSGAVDANYTISYVPGNVTVGQAALVITASSGTMTAGGTPPAITPSYSGFVAGNTAASLTTQPTCVTSVTSSSPAGTYNGADTCSGAVDPNYVISYVAGNMVVNSAGLTTPTITWPTPAPITYGTPLSSTQLDATANVAGTFVYTPPAKTILTAGTHTLTATFTPTNTSAYTTATATVVLQVNQATPPVLWVPVPTVYGIPLGPLQLDALTLVPGTFVYTPPAGTILHAGNQTLSATFTPNDTTDYKTITITATLVVLKAVPIIKWSQPASITVGTPLSSTQLDATANVPGAFVYSPAAGTLCPVGTSVLKVTFTPTDTSDYTDATAQVNLTVIK